MAEITRLKAIVDLAAARDGRVLFLLDEILGGTNSHDRRIGSEALLKGLVAAGAIGLVTTHDLALGEIATNLPGQALNVHFEDRFEDGELSFDYRLRPGIVQTSNAIALMRSQASTCRSGTPERTRRRRRAGDQLHSYRLLQLQKSYCAFVERVREPDSARHAAPIIGSLPVSTSGK